VRLDDGKQITLRFVFIGISHDLKFNWLVPRQELWNHRGGFSHCVHNVQMLSQIRTHDVSITKPVESFQVVDSRAIGVSSWVIRM